MPLLESDLNKQIIIDSLKYLSDKKLITVYAFVIIPNHIHLICLPAGRLNEYDLNGKETPKGGNPKKAKSMLYKESP